jgi:hypothetical protein
MSFGVMGGPMQPQGHVQMMTRMIEYSQNPQAASDAPRWRVLRNREVSFEDGFAPHVLQQLRERGHYIGATEKWGFGGAPAYLQIGRWLLRRFRLAQRRAGGGILNASDETSSLGRTHVGTNPRHAARRR